MITETTILLNDTYKIRAISRKEFKSIISNYEDPLVQENELCRLAVISWPSNFPKYKDGTPDLESCLAGIPESLARQILAISGFSDSSYLEKYVNSAVEWGFSEEGKRDILTLFVLPGVSLNDLYEADPEDLQKYYVASQIAGQAFLGINVIQYLEGPENGSGPSSNPAKELSKLGADNGLFTFTSK